MPTCPAARTTADDSRRSVAGSSLRGSHLVGWNSRRLGRRSHDVARGPSRRPAGAGGLTEAARSERGATPGPSFAHASEAELARILDFYEVRWAYEPDTFPIGWNLDGDVIESFSPDFYLPDLELYVELTTLKQKLVRKKNRKLRRLRELYPDVHIKLFYARDFRALLLKFGRMALVDELAWDDRPGHASARRCRGRGQGRGYRLSKILPSRRSWPSGTAPCFRESAILPHETTARMSGILRFAAAIPARGNGRSVKSASIALPRQARRLRHRYESVARRTTNRGQRCARTECSMPEAPTSTAFWGERDREMSRRAEGRRSGKPPAMHVATVNLRVKDDKRSEALSAIDGFIRRMHTWPGCLTCRLMTDAATASC